MKIQDSSNLASYMMSERPPQGPQPARFSSPLGNSEEWANLVPKECVNQIVPHTQHQNQQPIIYQHNQHAANVGMQPSAHFAGNRYTYARSVPGEMSAPILCVLKNGVASDNASYELDESIPVSQRVSTSIYQHSVPQLGINQIQKSLQVISPELYQQQLHLPQQQQRQLPQQQLPLQQQQLSQQQQQLSPQQQQLPQQQQQHQLLSQHQLQNQLHHQLQLQQHHQQLLYQQPTQAPQYQQRPYQSRISQTHVQEHAATAESGPLSVVPFRNKSRLQTTQSNVPKYHAPMHPYLSHNTKHSGHATTSDSQLISRSQGQQCSPRKATPKQTSTTHSKSQQQSKCRQDLYYTAQQNQYNVTASAAAALHAISSQRTYSNESSHMPRPSFATNRCQADDNASLQQQQPVDLQDILDGTYDMENGVYKLSSGCAPDKDSYVTVSHPSKKSYCKVPMSHYQKQLEDHEKKSMIEQDNTVTTNNNNMVPQSQQNDATGLSGQTATISSNSGSDFSQSQEPKSQVSVAAGATRLASTSSQNVKATDGTFKKDKNNLSQFNKAFLNFAEQQVGDDDGILRSKKPQDLVKQKQQRAVRHGVASSPVGTSVSSLQPQLSRQPIRTFGHTTVVSQQHIPIIITQPVKYCNHKHTTDKEYFFLCKFCGCRSNCSGCCDSCQRVWKEEGKKILKVTPVLPGPVIKSTTTIAPSEFYAKGEAATRLQPSPQTILLVQQAKPMAKRVKKKKAPPEVVTLSSSSEDEADNGEDFSTPMEVDDVGKNEQISTSTDPLHKPPFTAAQGKQQQMKEEDAFQLCDDKLALNIEKLEMGNLSLTRGVVVTLTPAKIDIKFSTNDLSTEKLRIVIDVVEVLCVYISTVQDIPFMLVYVTNDVVVELTNNCRLNLPELSFSVCSSKGARAPEAVDNHYILMIPKRAFLAEDVRKLSKIFSGSKPGQRHPKKLPIVNALKSKSDVTGILERRNIPLEKVIPGTSGDFPKSAELNDGNVLIKFDRITVTNFDLARLDGSEYLNDVIVDFYMQYIMQMIVSADVRKRSHVMGSYFFKRLTASSMEVASHHVDTTTPLSQRKHNRVTKWTRGVDLFSKDFVLVPVNENYHWFLVVICFPGLVVEKVTDAKEKLALAKDQPSPVLSDPSLDKCEEATTSDSPDSFTSSQQNSDHQECDIPSILVFDSLGSVGTSHQHVYKILREYLQMEWNTKKGIPTKSFNKDTVVACAPKVKGQDNFSDCGLYVLEYAEAFLKKPLNVRTSRSRCFTVPNDWFSDENVRQKRQSIKNLIKAMNTKQTAK